MAAIYFMGMVPEIPDGTRQSDSRCTCTAQANIHIKIEQGEISAACPVCSQEYVVLVETDHEGVHLTPVRPEQVIGGYTGVQGKFPLGRLMMTTHLQEVLTESASEGWQEELNKMVVQHAMGEWGEPCLPRP